MPDRLTRLTSQLRAAYDKAGFSERALRRKTIMKFAFRYGLIYFGSNNPASAHIHVLRGVTSSIDQFDTNICIGTHDGYDMVFVERIASVTHEGYAPATHQWHIMAFDLHSHSNLPFVFIGTRQQSKTFYAKLFTSRREVRQLDPIVYGAPSHFNANYTLIASPAEQLLLAQVLTTPVTSTMAKHQHPFAIEIQGDTLYVITETRQVSDAGLTKMLHYGLWLAKHLDENVRH